MKVKPRCLAAAALYACLLSLLTTSCAAPDNSATAKPTGRIAQNAAVGPRFPAVTVKLAANGEALLPIVIDAAASPRVQEAAKTLAEYLKRISGAEFKVTTGTALRRDTEGITVGLASQIRSGSSLRTDDPTRNEDYLLSTHASGVLLAGASELAVEHAVWDFLYRLGYRQFFPGEKWEVVPSEKNLSIAIHEQVNHPDYYARRIWFGYGSLPENRESYAAWNARNRATSGIALSTGHAYDAIINRNKAEFEKHPEYTTKPGGNKFCVSNPGLRQLVINDVVKRFDENPELQSVSLDPSDGGNWESDSCPDAKVIGSVTDRVITLANEVAEAVNKKYPGKYIGVYAYNEHSPPPTIKVHPNVVVSVATSFIRGGFTLEELLAGWNEKAEILGIREYYSVNVWDRDLPGSARGGNINYLTRTIPHFYNRGARFMSAESSDNWGPNGLGYYIASRLLWDGDEATQVEALTNDFLDKAFGSAREPMAEYYRLIDGSNKPLLSSDLLGRMYGRLSDALGKTNDPAIRARLHDLALYTRYVELYSAYSQSSGEARQAAFEEVMRYAWRIRGTQMIHTLGFYRDLPNRDKQVSMPPNTDYRVPEPKNPWKSSEPFTVAQIEKFISDGIANNPTISFEAVSFSQDLVPATPLKLTNKIKGDFKTLRGNSNFYTWVEKAPATLELQVATGFVYNNRGETSIALYPAAEVEGKVVAEAQIPPDKQTRPVQLQTDFDGLHRLNISDHTSGTQVSWRDGMPMTVESSLQAPTRFSGGRWTMHFYVPKGTKVVGGYCNGVGRLQNADGQIAKQFETADGKSYWSVPVEPGQDGKLWTLSSVSGQIMLMTVPPYLARSADEIMLPAEVVQADAAR